MVIEKPIVGFEFRYIGSSHRWAIGLRVRTFAIHRGGDEGVIINDDRDLDGGLRDDDIVEFQPWLDSLGRWLWITSDAAPSDLALL